MDPVQMVDLKRQYLRIKDEIDAAVLGVVASSNYIQGPEVRKFEENLTHFTGSNHVVSCANGTDALMAALMACGVERGDEVITVPFTFISTVETVALLGAVPVFADVTPDTFTINPDHIEPLITDKTKAIVPVHLFGQCADMERIMAIAKKHNLKVVEDACQALGAEYVFSDGTRRQAGTIGDVGCVSFFPTKNLGCFGDGGALMTQDDNMAEKLRLLCRHGSSKKYIHKTIGFNSRLDSVQAAVLNVKLKYLHEYISNRKSAADFYYQSLADSTILTLPAISPNSTHTFHQFTVKIKDGLRDNFAEYLRTNDIPSMIYYPVPAHLQPAYSYLNHSVGDFPVSEQLCNEVLSLPMHTELTIQQLQYISKTIVNHKI